MIEPDLFVVRYYEIALKHSNRGQFVQHLVQNVARRVGGTGVRHVWHGPSRILVEMGPQTDRREVQERLARVPGIANFFPAYRCERNLEKLVDRVLSSLQGHEFRSFAVRTRRVDKSFSVDSQECSRILGAAVCANSGARVDLTNPHLEIFVEIMPREIFFGFAKVDGPGGLPTGTSGTLLSLLSGGIDSPVAAHRMMRRGCFLHFVHFHGAPFQTRASRDKACELAESLARWQGGARLHLVPFGSIQREIVTGTKDRFRIILYRRMMMRIAEVLAERCGAEALVTGDSLGQVASQTLPNLTVVEQATNLPVLRPLIAMDKTEITAQARRIETYEISIQPDEDCCSLFVPRHPSTHMRASEAEWAEERFNIAAMVDSAVRQTEIVDFDFPPRREVLNPLSPSATTV